MTRGTELQPTNRFEALALEPDPDSDLDPRERADAERAIRRALERLHVFRRGARVALYDTRRKWSVALFGNNLLDEDGLVLHQENSAGAIKGMITTPRTYGLQLVKEW